MKTAILVFIFAWGGHQPRTVEHEYRSMHECLDVLSQTIIETSEKADDNEWVVIATCKYTE